MIKSWPNKEQSLERIKEYCKRRRPISVGGLSAPTLVAGQMAPDHNYTEAYVGVERPWLKEGSPIEAVNFFFLFTCYCFSKSKKKKDLERDDINDVEQNELEVDEVVEQELAFQALSGPKNAFRIFVNERVASQPQLAVFDIETFEIRSEGSFRVCTLKCATCWKRLQVALS
jgi:hypothetical protein